MDLEIQGSLEQVVTILKELGFTVKVAENKLEAKLRKKKGKYHVLGALIKPYLIYLDVHWDSPIHLLFIGVDYRKRPEEICNAIIQKAKKKGLKAEIIGGTSWFNRKNKAILKGLKI